MRGTAAAGGGGGATRARGRPLLLAWGFAFLGCLLSLPALGADPPRLMVSNRPIHALVAGLLQGVAEPELIPAEGTAVVLQPTPELRERLAGADLILWVGPELEPALAEVLREPALAPRALALLDQPALKVLPARKLEGGRDPYLWLDTRNMLILLDELTTLLGRLDPARAHRYRENRHQVLAQIAQVDRELEFGYKEVSAVPVFLYHDTHQYFEQAYAMKAAGIAASPAGTEPTAVSLLGLRSQLLGATTPCLFTEAAFPEPHLALLTEGTTARVVELDTLGVKLAPGPGLYAQLMRTHYQAIRDCLRPQAPPADAPPPASTEPAVEIPTHRIQIKYLLRSQFGEPVNNLDFRGRYQLIYFGYTFCPDVCPTSLVSLAQALALLGPKAERIVPLLITVDPARDTPEVLRTYTAYFHPRLLGLTGPEEMIARTAEQFRVRYEKVPDPGGDPSRYSMDHTASLFLLGPDSEFVAKFAYGLPAKALAAQIQALMEP